MVCLILRGTAPSIVLDCHVDTAVDEKLHRFVVLVEDQLVQNACRLVRAPSRIDVSAVLEKEVRNLEVVVEDGPGQRGVENQLYIGLAQAEPGL
jgi:hypothetical protein